MTSKQRAYLRSLASQMDTIFQIGKGGISDEMCKQISNALDARELIKLRVLDNAEYLPREAAEEIAQAVGAEVVTVIGTKFVLFRVSSKEKNRKIDLNAIK
ncbi:MAG: ribosome assembly RNA-binding protein YhbY [Ruminococcaceae bacterium]|nr:ribosome assembly RNA-binding protein YhbY [Oscillospiraceae bacterium]